MVGKSSSAILFGTGTFTAATQLGSKHCLSLLFTRVAGEREWSNMNQLVTNWFAISLYIGAQRWLQTTSGVQVPIKPFIKDKKLFGFRMRGAWRPFQRRYHQDILEQRKLIITNVENRDIA